MRLTACLLCAACISLTGKVGDALAPLLLASGWPLLLLATNANDAHLLLTTPDTSFPAWLLVAIVRRTAEDYFYFWLGRMHGADASDRLGFDLSCAARRWRQASLAAFLVFPSAPFCLLLGASTFGATNFVLVDLAASAARAILLRVSASTFSPLQAVLQGARAICEDHLVLVAALSTACALPGAAAALSLSRGDGGGWGGQRRAAEGMVGGVRLGVSSESVTAPSSPSDAR